jgi:hypothetical protein
VNLGPKPQTLEPTARAIDKEFTLFTKDGKSAGGSVHLKVSFTLKRKT